MFRKALLAIVILACSLLAVACGEVQQDYYEVHVIDGDVPFYYVNPEEGAELHNQGQFDNEETTWIYLYVPEEGVAFSYEQFYSPLGDRQVYREISSGRLFITRVEEVDDRSYQCWIDKEAFENPA